MLEALQAVPGANRCLFFVRQICASPSEFVWHDAAGQPHAVTQAEGGEQGMPAFCSLGQRAALAEVQARLAPSELLLAFLDDVYVIARPDRIRSIFDMLSDALWRHAHMRLDAGATGHESELASSADPVFVGSRSLATSQQGFLVLGVPVGSALSLRRSSAPWRAVTVSCSRGFWAWKMFRLRGFCCCFCCSPRSNHVLRLLPPDSTVDSTVDFALAHDVAIGDCLSALFQAASLNSRPCSCASSPW